MAEGEDGGRDPRTRYDFCSVHLVRNCRICQAGDEGNGELVEQLSNKLRETLRNIKIAAQRETGAANYEDLPPLPAMENSSLRARLHSDLDGNEDRQSTAPHNDVRPRSLPSIRRSHTSPDSFLNRPTNRPSSSSTAETADESNCHCSDTTATRPSVRKSIDSFLKATRRRFQNRSRRPHSVAADDQMPRSLPVHAAPPALPAQGMVYEAANLVIPTMNAGPGSAYPTHRRDDELLDRTAMPHIKAHTTIDYLHYIVPGLTKVTNCGFYWGVMDRYEAEALLDNKPEGTFLLRDSSQDDFIFSVSFRRYGRSLHARVEQWNHRFSFDAHDSGVFKADSVTALLDHYKDPQTCMFFEPMLTKPLNRPQPFSLLHLARSVVCDNITYDSIDHLRIPKDLQHYLKYYHYKQKIRVRTDVGWVTLHTNPLF